jgi:predicted MFS family arabinose efflux permease
MSSPSAVPQASRALIVLICGSLALALAMGIRQDFGLLLQPIVRDTGWTLGALSFGLAVQQIVMGLMPPMIGALADTRGPRFVIGMGGLIYVAGLVLMALGGTLWSFQLGIGVLVGMALGAVGFSVVFGAIARNTPPEKRSLYFGIASAGGSFGMFAFVPIGQMLVASLGWQQALLVQAGLALLIVPLGYALGGAPSPGSAATSAAAQAPGPTLRQTLSLASRHDGYGLLTIGFFVCGFHVAFISTHLPGYVASCGMAPEVGAWALALVGLFNIIGSLVAGQLGGRHRPKYLLSGLYGLRAVVLLAFILAPKSPEATLAFASAMGLLWLSTVPLTSGIVIGIFGPAYVSTLFGLVFLSHQVGAFLGAWLGGVSVDLLGSYDAVWWASVGLAVLATLVHLPIRDARLPQFQGA